ncbi:hypothetical protein [Microbacterium sp. A93]|uniref:hypothetical protein n=1 Tax=Microbacterium sp. A93 TaxID=3450716 RepID=UPI003F4277DB
MFKQLQTGAMALSRIPSITLTVAAAMVLLLTGCAADVRSAGTSDSSPATSATAQNTEVLRDDADIELDALVASWEEATSETCLMDLRTELLSHIRSAVYCGAEETELFLTFDNSVDHQVFLNGYEEDVQEAEGSAAVLDGGSWVFGQSDYDLENLQPVIGGAILHLGDTESETPEPEESAEGDAGESEEVSRPACQSVEHAGAFVSFWDDYVNGATEDERSMAYGLLKMVLESESDEDSAQQHKSPVGCSGSVEIAALEAWVGMLELANLTPDGVNAEDLTQVADAGDEYLKAVGREDLEFARP